MGRKTMRRGYLIAKKTGCWERTWTEKKGKGPSAGLAKLRRTKFYKMGRRILVNIKTRHTKVFRKRRSIRRKETNRQWVFAERTLRVIDKKEGRDLCQRPISKGKDGDFPATPIQDTTLLPGNYNLPAPEEALWALGHYPDCISTKD